MKSRCGIAAVVIALSWSWALIAQTTETAADLLGRFDAEQNLAAKALLLLDLTSHNADAGPALLRLAQSTEHPETRWMAIRGMGILHYAGGISYMEASLRDPDALVRANAARALGDLRVTDASGLMLAMFTQEQDPSALQQACLALSELGVKAAALYLRAKISVFRGQTRGWLIQALGSLGDASDVPQIAAYLDDGVVCDDIAASAIEELAGVTFGPKGTGTGGCPQPRTIAARAWWQSHKDAWPRCDDCHPPVAGNK